MAGFWRNENGTQKKAKAVWRNVNGTWKKSKAIWRNINGTWKKMTFAIVYGVFGGGNGRLLLGVTSGKKSVQLVGATKDHMANVDPSSDVLSMFLKVRHSTSPWGADEAKISIEFKCLDPFAQSDDLNDIKNKLNITIRDRATGAEYTALLTDVIGSRFFMLPSGDTLSAFLSYYDSAAIERTKRYLDAMHSIFSNEAQVDVTFSYEE